MDGETIIRKLVKRYGLPRTMLKHRSINQLFVAVLLSPQCTDKQVNNVTRELFKKYKSLDDYANADLKQLRKDLGGLNYYRTKAKNLRSSARMLLTRFGGRVPDRLEALMELPGVGRKVANVILANGFGIAGGIAVDTHCITVSKRLGLTRSSDPRKIEKDLMAKIPGRYWLYTSNLFIELGRDVCRKNDKRCASCVLKDICPSSTTRKSGAGGP